jgi:membrane protease YdiL (CAAX protease family)
MICVPPTESVVSRGRIAGEVLLVLGLSLGMSAIYAIVNLVDFSTRTTSLGSQSVSLNPSLSDRQAFDFIYQFLGLVTDLIPVALVIYLLWQAAHPHLGRLGVDFRHPLRDLGVGVLLALVIGAGGIGVYLGARALGLAVDISTDGIPSYWWAVPILLFSALRAALQEEFIVIGYLYARLRELGWGKWSIILSTAVFRGSYHLYQGYGGFIGNFIMGVIFGWLYTRYGRLLPFIVAHFLIDAATFVGYDWAHATFPALF